MQPTLTRRSFLRSSAVTTAGAGLAEAAALLVGPAVEAAAPTAVGPAAVPVSVTVNGIMRTLAVEPRTTLASLLRDQLGLTGTKIGCDHGACSACTVWLDGQPVCSCMTLAIDVGARAVTTIEGLAAEGELHPLQAAFIEHDALQCGFCTPGMVMSGAALLHRQPHPDRAQVKAAIGGHLCRCGTYPHVIDAILATAKAGAGAG
jgi:aerobic-type carbon monoxide dehydrogenase small subunit (CoxS/CutS family)